MVSLLSFWGPRKVLSVLCLLLCCHAGDSSTLEAWLLSKALKSVEDMSPSQRFTALATVAEVVKNQQSAGVALNTAARLRSDAADRFDTAVHEAAHAMAILESEESLPRCWRLKRVKLCVPSMGGAAGWTKANFGSKMRMPEARHLRALLRMQLAGRAAECELLGRVSAGASSDIVSAGIVAEHFVCSFGFGRSGLVATLGKQSEFLAEQRRLLTRGYAEARTFAIKNRDEIEAIARALFIHEELSGARVRAIVNAVRRKKGAVVPRGDRFGRYRFIDTVEDKTWTLRRWLGHAPYLTPPVVIQRRVVVKELLAGVVRLRAVRSLWDALVAFLKVAAAQAQTDEVKRREDASKALASSKQDKQAAADAALFAPVTPQLTSHRTPSINHQYPIRPVAQMGGFLKRRFTQS